MSFWDKIQEDLKKNFQEGLEIFREGSSVVTDTLGKFTEEGKKKYKVFNLNMKVQEDFAKLGGAIYDLIDIIARINKMENQITSVDAKDTKKTVKKTAKKTVKKSTAKKTVRKRSTAKKQTKKST